MNWASLFPFVFTNRRSTDRIKRFDKAWKKACKDARIGVWHFSYFKSRAVGNQEKAGIPVPVVMNVSNRKPRPVFDCYAIGDEKDLQEAANRQPA